MRTPNSRSCHSTCCGDGLISAEFCAESAAAANTRITNTYASDVNEHVTLRDGVRQSNDRCERIIQFSLGREKFKPGERSSQKLSRRYNQEANTGCLLRAMKTSGHHQRGSGNPVQREDGHGSATG